MTNTSRALLVVLVLAIGSWGIHESHWYTHRMIRRTEGSLVHLTGSDGSGVCSGFVVGENKILTAQHCVASSVAADGQAVKLIREDAYYDLAVLSVDTKKPALALQYVPVYSGQPVTAVGYAWGMLPVFEHGEVDIPDVTIQTEYAICILVDREDVNGMSGGPVIDQYGNLVSIVSRGNSGFACGVNVLLMQAFLAGVK